VYQRPDDATLASAFEQRRRYGASPKPIDTTTDTTPKSAPENETRRAS
jgi:hypothetical protein